MKIKNCKLKIPQSGYILGISCFYHDSSACLLQDGKLLSAAQEERFTRIKHDENFPKNAIKFCLEDANINIDDIEYIVFYEKPILKFDRLINTYIKNWPRGLRFFLRSMPIWLNKKIWISSIIKKELQKLSSTSANHETKILFVPHHISHAASSYFLSDFKEATVVTIDGVGEKSTTSIGIGKENNLELKKEIHFPHSLGLFYSAFTYFLGFKVNSAEYKVMGLAPYGKAKYKDKIRKLIKIYQDGSFKLDMKYFSYEYDLKMTGKKFEKHFAKKRRKEDEKLEQFHKDIAASLQEVLEEIVLKILDFAHKKYPSENLCLSGGVALNCVANGKIIKKSKFKNLFIFPAAGDAGGSVGAALFAHHCIFKNQKRSPLKDVFLGPKFKNQEIKEFLDKYSIRYEEKDREVLHKKIAKKINENKVIGLFQGRMEFGPRALGHRSIIADPRQKENWQRVNLKIKFRESFRPFAPAVLEEKITDTFDLDRNSPYMLLVAPVKSKEIPATTHVDNSARIQSVSKEQNPFFYQVIKEFFNLTNCPVVINTSFNIRGEPIVCDYQDAFKCFLRTDMDTLVLENFLIDKDKIDRDSLMKKFKFRKFKED